MAEYIEREKVLQVISEWNREDINYNIVDYLAGWNEAIEQLECNIREDIPAADVAPVLHGHWIFGEFNGIGTPVWCSECGERTKNIADLKAWLECPSHKYCGRCGAKMDVKDGENNV